MQRFKSSRPSQRVRSLRVNKRAAACANSRGSPAWPGLGGSRVDADGRNIVAKMKDMPTDDPLFGKGTIRADGRKIHDMYLLEVKKPDEFKGRLGLYEGAPTQRPPFTLTWRIRRSPE